MDLLVRLQSWDWDGFALGELGAIGSTLGRSNIDCLLCGKSWIMFHGIWIRLDSGPLRAK